MSKNLNINKFNVLNINEFNLQASSMIEASAGTGKTYTLTYLILRLLLGDGVDSPLSVDRLLCVTFTKAAAAEIKTRIYKKIVEVKRLLTENDTEDAVEKAAASDKYLDTILKNVFKKAKSFNKGRDSCLKLIMAAEKGIDNAAFCTIDSMCTRLLNGRFSFESGVDFNLEIQIGDGPYVQEAINQVWREIFYQQQNKDLMKAEGLASPEECNLKGYIKSLQKVISLENTDSLKPKFKISWEDPANPLIDLNEDLESQFSSIRTEILSGATEKAIEKLIVDFKNESSVNKVFNLDTGKASAQLYGKEYSVLKVKDLLKALDNGEIDKVLPEFEKLYKNQDIKNYKKDPASPFFISSNTKLDENRLGDITDAEEKFVITFKKYAVKLKNERTIRQKLISIIVAMKVIERIFELELDDGVLSNNFILETLVKAIKKEDALKKAIREQYPVAIIDEFQDTSPSQNELFRELYLNEEAKAQKFVCYVIGDPKQSIYRFRDADLNSYNNVKEKIRELNSEDAIYSMDTNFRSSGSIVEGVNYIFEEKVDPESSSKYSAFDYEKELVPSNIEYPPVQAQKSKSPLSGFRWDKDKDSASDFYIRKVNLLGIVREKISNDKYYIQLCEQVAADIKHILRHSCFKEGVSVQPKDIAIIVDTKKQADYLLRELAKNSIPAAYVADHDSVLFEKSDDFSKGSDLKVTEEAMNIFYLMDAVLNCTRENKVNRLFLCSLFTVNSGAHLNYLKKNSSDYEDAVIKLQKFHENWIKIGFLAAFEGFIDNFKLSESLDGNAIADYIHIAEIIQSQSSKIGGALSQYEWYKNGIVNVKFDDLTEDDTRIRLKTDANLIRLVTVHGSKGLQYKIVMLPFMYRDFNVREGESVIYDHTDKTLVYSFDKEKVDNYLITADKQEKVRTLYVALTRAEDAMFLYLSNFPRSWPSPHPAILKNVPLALMKLTNPLFNKIVEGCGKAEFESLEKSYLFSVLPPPDEDDEEPFMSDDMDNTDSEDNSSPKYAQNSLSEPIDTGFSIQSYSSISKNSTPVVVPKDSSGKRHDPSENNQAEKQTKVPSHFLFPKDKDGKDAGTYMHDIMEQIMALSCAQRNSTEKNAQGLTPIGAIIRGSLEKDVCHILEKFERNLLNADKKLSSDKNSKTSLAEEYLENWIRDLILKTPLPLTNSHSATLGELENTQCLREMEYFLPCSKFKVGAFVNIRRAFYETQFGCSTDKGQTTFAAFNGFFKGYLDLVARFNVEGEERYYLIDYKNSDRGSSFDMYSQEELKQAVFEENYDIQLLIYSVALLRFIKAFYKDSSGNTQVDEKQYAKFGGIMYLYFRGMSATGSGVYKVDAEADTDGHLRKVLLDLDAMLSAPVTDNKTES